MRWMATILLVLLGFFGQAQDQFLLSIDDYQMVEDPNSLTQHQMRLPNNETVVIMGGLDDLDGMGNYFNIYGGKLIVDTMNIASNGGYDLTLRREDGRNFYNLFPTLTAKIIPLTDETHKELVKK